MEQKTYVSNIEKLPITSKFEEFKSTRQKVAWISHTILEMFGGINILTQITKETFEKEDIRITDTLINT